MPRPKYTTEIESEEDILFRVIATLRKKSVRAQVYARRSGMGTFTLLGVLNMKRPEFGAFCNLIGADGEHPWEKEE